MVILHGVAMGLMIGSAIMAALCCLGAGRLSAGRAVPWQGRQSTVAMAAGMVALCAADGDARVGLLVAAIGLGSAMLGVAGLRGRPPVGACFHRALGCVAMAVCAVATLGVPAERGGPNAAAAAGHVGHGGLVPMTLLAVCGVGGLLALMLAERIRRRPVVQSSTAILLDVEAGAMALSLAVMGGMLLLG